jgi:hypothetical protein
MYYRQRHSSHGGARGSLYRFEAVLSPSSRGRFIVERMEGHWRLWIERDTIQELSTAIITGYMKYISEHRDMDSASVVTATALFVAVIVDSLTFQEDDPSHEEAMALIAEAAMKMLMEPDTIRDYVKVIFTAVMEEQETRQ